MAGLHTLTKSKTQKTKTRIGRGGKRGKTSGHGHKGQRQHGRHGVRPELRDMIKKLPKLRGYGNNRSKTVNDSRVPYTVVNLDTINEVFKSGEKVTPSELVARKVVSTRAGKNPKIKVLSRGEIKKKVSISGCAISKTAKEAVESAGGSVE